MSCTYYLRDRKITNETMNKLELLEKEFNSKIDNLYEENKSKYIIIDEYNREFTLDEFLNEVKLK